MHRRYWHQNVRWSSPEPNYGRAARMGLRQVVQRRFFLFYILKKIKFSKLYIRFGKFQKYTPVALWGATWLKCNFFFLQICNEVPRERKKRGGLLPPQRATGPCRPLGGRQGPYFPLSFEPKNSGKKRGVMKHRSINIPFIVCNGKYESDQ